MGDGVVAKNVSAGAADAVDVVGCAVISGAKQSDASSFMAAIADLPARAVDVADDFLDDVGGHRHQSVVPLFQRGVAVPGTMPQLGARRALVINLASGRRRVSF